MQPPRHALGALLLEQDRIDDALAVYSADLGLDSTLPRALQHPNNVWALHGYHECLMKLGRSEEVGLAQKQLELVTATADVPIASSCYCRSKGISREKPSDETQIAPWRFNKGRS